MSIMRNKIEEIKDQNEDSENLINAVAAILSNYREDSINSDMCLIHYVFAEMQKDIKIDAINSLSFDRIVYRFSRDLYDALYKLENSVISTQTINNESYYILSNIKSLKEYYMSKFSLEEQKEIIKGSDLLNSKMLLYKPNIKEANSTYGTRKSLR